MPLLGDDLEAKAAVEGQVGLGRGFQTDRKALSIGGLEDRSHDRAAQATALERRLHSQNAQVPATLGGQKPPRHEGRSMWSMRTRTV